MQMGVTEPGEKRPGSTRSRRVLTTGDQRAQPKVVGGKEAGLGPGKTQEGTRLLKDISTTWGLKASYDPIRANY